MSPHTSKKRNFKSRDAGSVKFHLDHPHVSRLHASLAVDGGRVVLADLGSSNGTYVNGKRLSRPTPLDAGDRIDIGPFSLQFDGTGLKRRSRSNNVELAARGLKRVVQDRETGKPLTLLDDINLVIRPREFICLLGPSGSGKSTLLAILSGRSPPDAGKVTVNSEDLYNAFEALKEDIAVAQASLLFGIVRAWCRPPGAAALQWLTLASLATASTAVGLLISTIAPSEEVATALVPITVIPQIILGGVIAPLSGIARSLAEWFISVHWG